MNKINFNGKNDVHFQKNDTNCSKYNNVKAVYIGYVKKMNKSDLANSLTRYQVEHAMLKDMYKLALEEKRIDEIENIKKRYKLLAEKFEQFGVTLKSIEE